MEDEVGEVGGDVNEGGRERGDVYMALHNNVTRCTKDSGFMLAWDAPKRQTDPEKTG